MDNTSRLDFFNMAKRFANQHSNNVCAFHSENGEFKIEKRIGSESKFGEVYLVSSKHKVKNKNNDKGKSLQAAVKLMPVNYKNERELYYYNLFNDYVTGMKNPHYPLVFYSRTCTQCPFENSVFVRGSRPSHRSIGCYVAFKELADGDLKQWLKTKHTIESYLSLVSQTVLAGFAIEKEGLIHGDMHWGNMLHHSVPSKNKGKYIFYLIKDFKVYIKIVNEHWVLWDFGKMKTTTDPYRTSFNIDMDRISHIAKWIRENRELSKDFPALPKAIERLYDNFNTYVRSRPIGDYTSLLLFMHEYMKAINPTILLVNPLKPPPTKSLINTTPYTLG